MNSLVRKAIAAWGIATTCELVTGLMSWCSRVTLEQQVDIDSVIEIHGDYPWYFLGRNEESQLTRAADEPSMRYIVNGDDIMFLSNTGLWAYRDRVTEMLQAEVELPGMNLYRSVALTIDLEEEGSWSCCIDPSYRRETHPWRVGYEELKSGAFPLFCSIYRGVLAPRYTFDVKRQLISALIDAEAPSLINEMGGFSETISLDRLIRISDKNQVVVQLFEDAGFEPIELTESCLMCDGACGAVRSRLVDCPPASIIPEQLARVDQSVMSCELHPDAEQVEFYQLGLRTLRSLVLEPNDECDVIYMGYSQGQVNTRGFKAGSQELFNYLKYFPDQRSYFIVPSPFGTTIFHVHFRPVRMGRIGRFEYTAEMSTLIVLRHRGGEAALAANRNKMMHMLYGNTSRPTVGGLTLRSRPSEVPDGKPKPMCQEPGCGKVAHYFDPRIPQTGIVAVRCFEHKLDSDDSDQTYKRRCHVANCSMVAAFGPPGGHRDRCFNHRREGDLNEKAMSRWKKTKKGQAILNGKIDVSAVQKKFTELTRQVVDLESNTNAPHPTTVIVEPKIEATALVELAGHVDTEEEEDDELMNEVISVPVMLAHMVDHVGYGAQRTGSLALSESDTGPAMVTLRRPLANQRTFGQTMVSDTMEANRFKVQQINDAYLTLKFLLFKTRISDAGFTYALVSDQNVERAGLYDCEHCDFNKYAKCVFAPAQKVPMDDTIHLKLHKVRRGDVRMSSRERYCAAYGCHTDLLTQALRVASEMLEGFVYVFPKPPSTVTGRLYPLFRKDWSFAVQGFHPPDLTVTNIVGPCLIFAGSDFGGVVYHAHIIVVPSLKLDARPFIQIPRSSIIPLVSYAEKEVFDELTMRVLRMARD